jgi:hypothetical protein
MDWCLHDFVFHVVTCWNSIAGNSMICSVNSGDNCSSVSLDPLSYPPDDLKSEFFFHYSVVGYTLPVKKNLIIVFLVFELTHVSFSSALPQQGVARSHRIAIICGGTVGSVAFITMVVCVLLWLRHRHNRQIFFDVNGNISSISLLCYCYRPMGISLCTCLCGVGFFSQHLGLLLEQLGQHLGLLL